MLFANFANALRNQIAALGNHAWRAHLAFAIFQRDCKVRWVGHDDIGLRYRGHHPFAGNGPLLASNAGLELWIAFHFALLLTDFFTRHLEAAVVMPELVWRIDQRDQHQPAYQREEPGAHDGA